MRGGGDARKKRDATSRGTPAAAVVILVLACSVCGAVGSTTPGPVFPFYDNCRRNASFSRWSLRMIRPVVSLDASSVRACFLVRVNTSAPCKEEVFTSRGEKVVSRCCNTNFAKVKVWVDPKCRTQFVASPVTVPTSSALSKVVSPSWDRRPDNYTEVKYTQFGPIPQNILNGTTFCLTLKKEGPCNVSSLLGITSPFNRARRLLQVAMYDRKVDGYECCPTYTFSL